MAATTELERRFSHHPPRTASVANDHADVREWSLRLAEMFDATLPEGREKACAITKVEEAMFWANAAIARPRSGQ